MSIDLALIGGTGLYQLAALQDVESAHPVTPFGEPSGPVRIGNLHGRRVAFLARHGESHGVAPHRINYRANLRALADLGARHIVAVNAVGGIGAEMGPRVLAVPDQLIDYTWGRESTFCDVEGAEVAHAEFADPYDAELRSRLIDAANAVKVVVVDHGVYGCTQGPRLETRAEIARMHRDGCDLVGMTGMPEAALARELNLPYVSLCIVANWAAGCDPDDRAITLQEVLDNVSIASSAIPSLLEHLLKAL